jgi:acyl-CoA hydrolase
MWFVESGFIAAASFISPERIVCLNIHGMLFMKPIHNGSIIRFESRVVFAGETRLVSYIRVVDNSNDDFLVDGFITFIHVDKNARRIPHGVVFEWRSPRTLPSRKGRRACRSERR